MQFSLWVLSFNSLYIQRDLFQIQAFVEQSCWNITFYNILLSKMVFQASLSLTCNVVTPPPFFKPKISQSEFDEFIYCHVFNVYIVFWTYDNGICNNQINSWFIPVTSIDRRNIHQKYENICIFSFYRIILVWCSIYFNFTISDRIACFIKN